MQDDMMIIQSCGSWKMRLLILLLSPDDILIWHHVNILVTPLLWQILLISWWHEGAITMAIWFGTCDLVECTPNQTEHQHALVMGMRFATGDPFLPACAYVCSALRLLWANALTVALHALPPWWRLSLWKAPDWSGCPHQEITWIQIHKRIENKSRNSNVTIMRQVFKLLCKIDMYRYRIGSSYVTCQIYNYSKVYSVVSSYLFRS